jgi:oxygen-independent coproporphyrinogen-3 oxidase
MKPFSLYIHIPFCFHKCPYCDFNTYAVTSAPEGDYTSALLSELDSRAVREEWKGRTIQTIFFGGGTPSLFAPQAIGQIINGARERFTLAENLEITLEANPGTVTLESLQGYRSIGVNRISLGAQSFQIPTLKVLGRMHSPQQVEAAVESTYQAGFENLSLDLMFGVAEQDPASFRADLSAALNLQPTHLSAYGLTIERGTPYFSAFRRGALKLPNEDLIIEMMEDLFSVTAKNGLGRYEISNFAKPGFEARHNLAYWNGDDYLGLGAGAHSFCRSIGKHGTRWSNYALPAKYSEESRAKGQAEGWREQLDLKNAIFEFFFLGLRKTAGVNTTDFETHFGEDFRAFFPNVVELLIAEGLIEFAGQTLKLSNRGLMVADSVIENFADPEIGESEKAA